MLKKWSGLREYWASPRITAALLEWGAGSPQGGFSYKGPEHPKCKYRGSGSPGLKLIRIQGASLG